MIPQANMGDLPVEMVELILSNLSWPDVARFAFTCSAFKSAFHQAQPREQERRCTLAVARFGRARINWIADLISRSLRGESISRGNGGPRSGSCRICPNVKFLESSHYPGPPIPLKAREVYVDAVGWGMHMELTPQKGSQIFVRTCRKRRMAMISVYPCNNEDLAGVALLQVLLSGGLAPLSGDVWEHFDIRVMGYSWNAGITQAGLRMQIAPLLPFASQYISASQETGIPTAIGERMKVDFRT
jgi:hypothetical protein